MPCRGSLSHGWVLLPVSSKMISDCASRCAISRSSRPLRGRSRRQPGSLADRRCGAPRLAERAEDAVSADVTLADGGRSPFREAWDDRCGLCAPLPGAWRLRGRVAQPRQLDVRRTLEPQAWSARDIIMSRNRCSTRWVRVGWAAPAAPQCCDIGNISFGMGAE
jgi:hypothetical protein